MQHDAARLKGLSSSDEPSSQPMRPAARGQIARNPSTDQKRQRRLQMRKSAEIGENTSANGWTPGHVSCGSCGYKGHPRLGDTGPECGACGSYSVSSTKPKPVSENSRYLNSGDYHLQAAKDPNAYLDKQCPGCGGPRNERNPEGTCNSCLPEKGEGYGISGSDEDTWNPRQAARGGKCRMCKNDADTKGGLCDPCLMKNERSKTATVLDTRAEMLNPGDQIKNPQGKTQKVIRVRPHEQSAKHVYVDTDGGTALVERSSSFQVAPKNSQQQSLPGYGTPGGNSNHLPFDPQTSGSNSAPTTKCPQCQGPGTLARQGDHYSCSRCGYREQFGGAGGHAFTDAPSTVRTFSTINNPVQSVVARRAAALLNQSEETP